MQFARLTNMHNLLTNYTKFVMKEYTENGIPAQRPLLFVDETDAIAKNIKFQYMYGPDLIIAPALSAGEYNKSVYIPTGSWIHIWSAKEYIGKQHVAVESKLGEPAVFYQKGSNFTTIFQQIGQMKAIPLAPITTPSLPVSTQSASTVYTNTFLIVAMYFIAKLKVKLFAIHI